MGELVRLSSRLGVNVERPRAPIACREPESPPPRDPFFGLLLLMIASGWAVALLLLAFGYLVGSLILGALRL